MDLAPDSRHPAHVPPRLHRFDRVARRRAGLHQPPAASVSAVHLAPPRGRGGGRVPRLGCEEVRGSALGPIACETPTAIAARLRARGLRVPDGVLPDLRRRALPRTGPNRYRAGRSWVAAGRNAPRAPDLG